MHPCAIAPPRNCVAAQLQRGAIAPVRNCIAAQLQRGAIATGRHCAGAKSRRCRIAPVRNRTRGEGPPPLRPFRCRFAATARGCGQREDTGAGGARNVSRGLQFVGSFESFESKTSARGCGQRRDAGAGGDGKPAVRDHERRGHGKQLKGTDTGRGNRKIRAREAVERYGHGRRQSKDTGTGSNLSSWSCGTARGRGRGRRRKTCGSGPRKTRPRTILQLLNSTASRVPYRSSRGGRRKPCGAGP